jgi:hypothetical protein
MAYGKSQIVDSMAGVTYPRTITFAGPKRSAKKSAASKSMRIKGTMKRSRRK